MLLSAGARLIFWMIYPVSIWNDISLSFDVLGLEDFQSLMWVEGDAEALCFEDASMDGYTIAFGIRNVTHIEKVLAEAYRSDPTS